MTWNERKLIAINQHFLYYSLFIFFWDPVGLSHWFEAWFQAQNLLKIKLPKPYQIHLPCIPPKSMPHGVFGALPRQVEVPLYETCHSMCSKNPFCSIYVDNQTGCFIGDSAAETDVDTQKTRSGGSFNLSKQVFILVVKSLAWKWVWNDHCFWNLKSHSQVVVSIT